MSKVEGCCLLFPYCVDYPAHAAAVLCLVPHSRRGFPVDEHARIARFYREVGWPTASCMIAGVTRSGSRKPVDGHVRTSRQDRSFDVMRACGTSHHVVAAPGNVSHPGISSRIHGFHRKGLFTYDLSVLFHIKGYAVHAGPVEDGSAQRPAVGPEGAGSFPADIQ